MKYCEKCHRAFKSKHAGRENDSKLCITCENPSLGRAARTHKKHEWSEQRHRNCMYRMEYDDRLHEWYRVYTVGYGGSLLWWNVPGLNLNRRSA